MTSIGLIEGQHVQWQVDSVSVSQVISKVAKELQPPAVPRGSFQQDASRVFGRVFQKGRRKATQALTNLSDKQSSLCLERARQG